jgi:energy-coupling factor transport system ATP-binding protein
MLCIVGGNGSGKTTLLRLLCGFEKPLSGKILMEGRSPAKRQDLWYQGLACLPQEPGSLFGEETVEEELRRYCEKRGILWEHAEALAERLGVARLLGRHPMDLSGGELQLCALCRILLQKPKVLLLDEPTKGLDAFAKERLGKLLRELVRDGVAVLTVTHDLDFSARWGDRCSLLFDGVLTSPRPVHAFFAQSRFYTTPVSRITDGVCVTVEELLQTIQRKEV